jgi:hypothetical protein
MERDSDSAIFFVVMNCFVFGSSTEKHLLFPGLSSVQCKVMGDYSAWKGIIMIVPLMQGNCIDSFIDRMDI